MSFVKFLKTPFFKRAPPVAASAVNESYTYTTIVSKYDGSKLHANPFIPKYLPLENLMEFLFVVSKT